MYRRYTMLLQLAQGKDVEVAGQRDYSAVWALLRAGHATLVITPEGMKEAWALSPKEIAGAQRREEGLRVLREGTKEESIRVVETV